jgi:predicted AAA+ superfamily ATPase
MTDLVRIKEIAFGMRKGVESFVKRYFLNSINIGKEPRIKVLRGFRGLGKTTALLQLMEENAIYFSMDHSVVADTTLYDVSREFVQEGYKILLIDEVHYYPAWKRDTKALYDEFQDLTLVLSGSAPLAFEPERRYEIIDVMPLSLREFAHLQGKEIESTEAWKSQDETLRFLASNNWIYEYYKTYMSGGAFPLYFTYKEKTLKSIYNSIRKSIKEDAPFFARVDGEMIRAMERLIVFLSSTTLGELSIHSLSKILQLSKHKTYEIVSLMEAMGILRLIKPYGKGAKLVRGEPKLMFSHPVMRAAVCNELGAQPNIGALREELAVFSFIGRGWNVSTIKGMKKSPDYIVEKNGERCVVEIGGPSKGRNQLKEINADSFVITDRELITLAIF